MRRRPVVLLAAAAVIGAIGLGAQQLRGSGPDRVVLSDPGQTVASKFPTAPKLGGKTLPDVPLQDFSGAKVTLGSLVGKPAVINVWQESCLPCKEEMPAFEAVHKALGDRVRFVGIDSQDAIDRAREFAKKTGVTYDLWRDPEGQFFSALKLIALPSTVFVDASGHIVFSRTGAMTGEQLTAKINELFPA